MYEDKTLVCKECGRRVRLHGGRAGVLRGDAASRMSPSAAKRAAMPARPLPEAPESISPPLAHACGGEARVPFEPKSDRPVYCSECFAKMREQA